MNKYSFLRNEKNIYDNFNTDNLLNKSITKIYVLINKD